MSGEGAVVTQCVNPASNIFGVAVKGGNFGIDCLLVCQPDVAEDEAVEMVREQPLVSRAATETLLEALQETGIEVRVESNARHRIGRENLEIVLDPAAIPANPHAMCIDGLDRNQWALLTQLHQPGERLPLVIASAEKGAFRVVLCNWVDSSGLADVHSFDHLQTLVAAWDGEQPIIAAWQMARQSLTDRAYGLVGEAAERSVGMERLLVERQHEAARTRLVDELGRLLICFEPDTDDLNGKFHRLMSERTATAERLRLTFERLGDYPRWESWHLRDLREFRLTLTVNQIKARLTGRELDAALADPRWQVCWKVPIE